MKKRGRERRRKGREEVIGKGERGKEVRKKKRKRENKRGRG